VRLYRSPTGHADPKRTTEPTDVTDEPKSSRSGRAELAGLVLAIALPASLVSLWASPRPARPVEMPALVLSAADVRAEIAAQDRLASAAATDEDEHRRRTLYREANLAEIAANDSPEVVSRRTDELHRLVAQRAAAGGDAVAAIRARDVQRMLPALRGGGDTSDDDRAAELGIFPETLERYGAVARGVRVAPEIVIRAMFMARWNAMGGLPLTDGMSPIALRAYHGWLAMEGGSASLSLRQSGLDHYAAVGGWRVGEGRAVLAFEAGDFAEAQAGFEQAYDRVGTVRLRNHALAAAERAESGSASP
jgi:hypothetical protein